MLEELTVVCNECKHLYNPLNYHGCPECLTPKNNETQVVDNQMIECEKE